MRRPNFPLSEQQFFFANTSSHEQHTTTQDTYAIPSQVARVGASQIGACDKERPTAARPLYDTLIPEDFPGTLWSIVPLFRFGWGRFENRKIRPCFAKEARQTDGRRSLFGPVVYYFRGREHIFFRLRVGTKGKLSFCPICEVVR